jgi:hypothetical protein
MTDDVMRAKATAGRSPARFLTRTEAAAYLDETWGIQRAPATLKKLACTGGGPTYCRIGRQVRYAPRDLDRWARGLISPPLSRARDLRQPVRA